MKHANEREEKGHLLWLPLLSFPPIIPLPMDYILTLTRTVMTLCSRKQERKRHAEAESVVDEDWEETQGERS